MNDEEECSEFCESIEDIRGKTCQRVGRKSENERTRKWDNERKRER